MSVLSPLSVIAQGAKLNPQFTRLVFGVPTVLAALALGLSFVKDTDTAVIGGIIVIALTVVIFAISQLAKLGVMAFELIWFVRALLLLFVVVVALIVTSSFFAWPQPLPCTLRPFTAECSRIAGNQVSAPPATAPAAAPPPAAASSLRPSYTVWIQFAGYPRPAVTTLGDALKATGWKAPGAERVGSAAGLNEIRYRSGDDKEAADLLAADMAKAGFKVDVRPVSIIQPKTLEIWVSQ